MRGALQTRLDLAALEDGVVCFGASGAECAVAVLDVVGEEGSLARADDTVQEELLAGRAQFLNAQSTLFQILVRAEPVDLESHLQRVRSRGSVLHDALAEVARDYVGFVERLMHQRTLLERLRRSSLV